MPLLICVDGSLEVPCARGIALFEWPVERARQLLVPGAVPLAVRAELAATTPMRELGRLFPRACDACGRNHAQHLSQLRKLWSQHKGAPQALNASSLYKLTHRPPAVGRLVRVDRVDW